jgi:signal transduction histidine kinase
MLLNASPEFVALCRAQVALTQGLGASLSVVYLTEDLSDISNTTLIPIAAYPEAAENWELSQVLALLSLRNRDYGKRLLDGDTSSLAASPPSASLPALPSADEPSADIPFTSDENELAQQQIVLPLIHEDMVMGLLVAARTDRAWTEREQSQIERIATTLSLACMLDQRSQWLDQDLRQQRLLRAQQHDVFDDLLHQFRNPLTALRTFGKLLVRRLLSEDPNRDVAKGIVQESDRLQELLKQFDRAIDLGEADLLPLLPSSQSEFWNTAPVNSPQIGPQDIQASGQSGAIPLLPSTRFLAGTDVNLEDHTVSEVLTPLLDSASAIAQERQINLQVALPSTLPSIKTDGKTLREVLSNLLDNALKYTPSEGTVYVWAIASSDIYQNHPEHNHQLAIAISDTGPGIPANDLAHLFERHYRGIQANTNIPGTGLGLAIARDLLRQLHGEIHVYSPANTSGLPSPFPLTLNAGTTVVVWLPEVEGC